MHKLSKIGTAQRVYRGVSSQVVPPWLWRRPAAGSATAEAASRGGIEFGFLSTTTDAEQVITSHSYSRRTHSSSAPPSRAIPSLSFATGRR